ncbi:LLM class flavin-dependent oxidoreductase [Microbacterium sp.]|uniref:LLM class flavin-dependent oxidoreductase n=1 Tax=Microbacterium sp. TaxID=51671 RepID=UPI0025CE2E9E|nr:LLM class flavin-dependent oxidoreductase [Microbacterium sp.]
MTAPVHLAVALDRAGWHPAAWRDPSATPLDLQSPAYWRALLETADRAGIVLATIEDALSFTDRFESADEPAAGRVRGRLDAVLIAAYAAPSTQRIGLIPTVTTAHTEPFHVATGIQTLDFASRGRAGVRLVAGSSPAERANFGRRASGPDGLPASLRVEDAPEFLAAFRETGEVAEVLRRLWDSWEDEAIVRDEARGLFLDPDRVHPARFEGEFFAVEGASIVPRSPQGQPLIAVLAHQRVPYLLAAESADVVFVTPHDEGSATGILAELDQAVAHVHRRHERLRVFADLVVLVEETASAARDAAARLDDLAGAPFTSDARYVVGTPLHVVDEIRALAASGVDGVRLRPARQPRDVVAIAERVLPLLDSFGGLRRDDRVSLRGRLGLERPASRPLREKVSS